MIENAHRSSHRALTAKKVNSAGLTHLEHIIRYRFKLILNKKEGQKHYSIDIMYRTMGFAYARTSKATLLYKFYSSSKLCCQAFAFIDDLLIRHRSVIGCRFSANNILLDYTLTRML